MFIPEVTGQDMRSRAANRYWQNQHSTFSELGLLGTLTMTSVKCEIWDLWTWRLLYITHWKETIFFASQLERSRILVDFRLGVRPKRHSKKNRHVDWNGPLRSDFGLSQWRALKIAPGNQQNTFGLLRLSWPFLHQSWPNLLLILNLYLFLAWAWQRVRVL